MGRIYMNLAMSLDGFIADENGGYDWIEASGRKSLNTENKIEYEDFLDNIDVVIMGKNCFEEGFYKDFSHKKVYVATRDKKIDRGNISFISEGITEIALEEVARGKKVFLFGGGLLLDNFVRENIIDEYIVGVLPIILGGGRRLFLDAGVKIELSLKDYSVEDGVTILNYIKRDEK